MHVYKYLSIYIYIYMYLCCLYVTRKGEMTLRAAPTHLTCGGLLQVAADNLIIIIKINIKHYQRNQYQCQTK